MHVKEEINNTLVIEKSKFICFIKPIFNEDEYKEYLKSIKKKYYDSTHVCSALICGNIKRSSDDGEPSGTAGIPILNVLEKNNLDNTCALVIRYFGGIKLGTGGLARAYSNSVIEALNKASIVEDVKYPKYKIELPYDVSNKLDNFFLNNTLYLNKEYDETVTIEYVLKDNVSNDKVIEISKGKLPILVGEEIIEKVIK